MRQVTDFHIGQRVDYCPPNSYGLRHNYNATVVALTAKRIRIKVEYRSQEITVRPHNLRPV